MITLKPDICYQAVLTHDPRFDGVFFVGVKTTGIYCRTVCPAKTPALKSCKFFSNAALAERDGFRPCLRCRPELAPGSSKVDAVPRLALLIANRIEDGALQEGSLEELALDVGIGSRHLRRVIEKEFGVSPIDLAQTQRLLHAKRLLADSHLPITEIAFASGFSSVRRFNALFQERYGLKPSDIRKANAKTKSETLTCDIAYIPPFDWSNTLDFLDKRSCLGVEAVESGKYMRTARFGKHAGWLTVEHIEASNALRIRISESLAPAYPRVVARVKRLFDTYCNPGLINDCLGEIAVSSPGIRVLGAFDGFETSVRGIIGQQISVKGATTMAGRLATQFGTPIETPFPKLTRLAPTAERIAQAEPAEIVALGFIQSRANTILGISRALAQGSISLEPGADVERTMAEVMKIKGIGEWTAQYIAMRVLSWPDAFPHNDLGIKKALPQSSSAEILQVAEQWRPWRAYAAMHLWASLSPQ